MIVRGAGGLETLGGDGGGSVAAGSGTASLTTRTGADFSLTYSGWGDGGSAVSTGSAGTIRCGRVRPDVSASIC